MRFSNAKKIIALALVLLLCVVGCVALFVLSGQQEGKTPVSEDTQQEADTVMKDIAAIDPSRQRYLFRLAEQREEPVGEPGTYYQKYFLLDGQIVRLVPGEEDDIYYDICDISGAVLQSISSGDFLSLFENEDEIYSGLSLDSKGTLWCLISDADGNYSLRSIGEDRASYALGSKPFQYGYRDMGVWGKYAVLLGQAEGVQNGYRMCVYDLDAGTSEVFDNVSAFCLDDSGNIYYTQYNTSGSLLVCLDLNSGTIIWQSQAPVGEAYNQVFFHPQLGVFTCSSRSGRIHCHSIEDGEILYELFTWSEDTGLDFDSNRIYFSNFAVDSDYNVHICVINYDNEEPPFTYTMYTWIYEPYDPTDVAAGTVKLTITAPYRVNSVDASVRMFQRQHPEVEVAWDVSYDSEDDFLQHSAQYAEQLSLRLMTGDVGDILMLSGYGLDEAAVLETDVLLGLDDYLAECTFLQDLDVGMLEPLRDETGVLRALPLGVNPNYLIYNKSLADDLGLDWDPDHLTWSQILDLGVEWYEQGEDLTLFSCMNTTQVDAIVTDLLLANLDAFADQDSADEIAPLLENVNMLLDNSQNLYRDSEAQFWWSPGFFDNALFALGSEARYEDYSSNLAYAEEENGIELQLIPIPLGEDGVTRQTYADSWGISSRSEHIDQAWELLEFLLSEDGFDGDIYKREMALLNRVADQQRYDDVEGHGYTLQPRHYQEYRHICTLPATRCSEPVGWIEAVWNPVLDYLKEEKVLETAIREAVENWERQLVQ